MYLPRRFLSLAAAATLLSFVTPTFGDGDGPKATVTLRKLTPSVLLTGELEAANSLTIFSPSTRVWGLTISYLAPDGSEVKEGETLVRFDSSRLEMEKMDLEKKREDARLAISQKEADIDSRRQDLLIQQAVARKTFDVSTLYASIDPSLIPRADAEKYRYDLETARIELNKADEALTNLERTAGEELAVVKLDLSQAELSLRMIQEEMSAMDIKAPRSGMVMLSQNWQVGRPLQVGDKVFDGQPILQMPDVTTLRVNAKVHGVDLPRIQPGLPVEVILDAFPGRVFQGKLGVTAEAAKTEFYQSKLKLFRAQIDLSGLDASLMKPGMTVRARVPLPGNETLSVPREAITLDSRGAAFVTLPGSPHSKVPVNVLEADEQYVAIQGNVKEGTEVILDRTAPAAAVAGPAKKIDWVEARKQDLTFPAAGNGSVFAENAANVAPPSLPRVWEYKIIRMAEEGSQIKKGDFVVQFDPSEVARRLQTEMADLQKAQREIQRSGASRENGLKDLELSVEDARTQRERAINKLRDTAGFESAMKVKEAQYEAELAKKRVSMLEQKLASVKRSGALQDQMLNEKVKFHSSRVKAYQEAMQALEVKSPASGVVLYETDWNGQKRQVGATVFMMDTVLSIPDLNTLRVAGQIAEADSGKVRVGQRVTVTFDAIQEKVYHGTITKVARTLSQASYEKPVKVLEVIVRLDENDPRRLKPGMAAKLEVEVDSFRDVLAVPLSAVEVEGTQAYVFVNQDGKAVRRAVKLGRNNGMVAIVESGLAPGEKVAVRAKESSSGSSSPVKG